MSKLRNVRCSIIPSGIDAWSDMAVQASAQQAQTLTYRLRDESSSLVVWLPNRIAIGEAGKGSEWKESRFFNPDQEAKARELATALKGLAPIQTAWVKRTKSQYWCVQVKLSRQWQDQQGLQPPVKPNPQPYSRILPKGQGLDLPTWYAEAHEAGYQSLCFKYGNDHLVVHLPQSMVVGSEGKGQWENCFFFEDRDEAWRFAACLWIVRGIKDVQTRTSGEDNLRYLVRVIVAVPAAETVFNPSPNP